MRLMVVPQDGAPSSQPVVFMGTPGWFTIPKQSIATGELDTESSKITRVFFEWKV